MPPRLMGGRGWFLALPFLFVILAGTVQAQDASPADSSQFRPYQIGVSAGALVKILEQPDAPERYQLYGRYRVNRDWALRTALRYNHRFGGEHDLDVAVRIGADRLLRTNGRLQVYGGLDLVTVYQQRTTGNWTYRVGGAPLLGVLVSITPNISLSVEPRLVALYSHFQNRDRFTDDDDVFSVELKGDGLLILSVHF